MNTVSRKGVRLRVGLCVVSFLALFIALFTFAESFPSYPTVYSNPAGNEVSIEDFHIVRLNGVELEEERLGFQEQWLRACGNKKDYILPAALVASIIFLSALLFRRLYHLPPFYIMKDAFGARKGVISGVISLRKAPGGIIGVRCWDLNKGGYLKSTAMGTIWEKNNLQADVSPQVGGWHGIYAYRLGAVDDCGGTMGLVSLSGRIVGHKDELIRAEECTILVLVTNKEADAEILRTHYNCPVIVDSNPDNAIQRWTLGAEGIFWLKHNHELIQNKINDKLDSDISDIYSYQSF